MKHILRNVFTRVLAFTFALLMIPMTAFASEEKKATPVGENSAWIRAKLVYEYDDGITGLNDSIVSFADKWGKSDGWYYYKMPVGPGDRVRFITGLKIPTSWTSELSDKRFRVIVKVEAAEVAPGDTGWNENSEVVYSKTYDIWSKGYEHDDDVWVEEGHLTVGINEYQLDKDGNEVAYVNDKIVTPGQPVSKIVEFEIGGRKGANVKLVQEKPVKRVMVKGVDVDGKIVNGGTLLTYTITQKNPAPDERTITVTDVVDERLTVTKIEDGGNFIKDPVDEHGGTIEWKVPAKGNETVTVSFQAKAPEGSFDEKNSLVIPNTADVGIFKNKSMKTNTVIVCLGKPSALKKVIARATGDPRRLAMALGVAIALTAAAIAVMAAIIKHRKEENDLSDEMNDRHGERKEE